MYVYITGLQVLQCLLTLYFLKIYQCKHKEEGMVAYIHANFLLYILIFYIYCSRKEKKEKEKEKNESILYRLR